MTYEKPIFFENDAHWSAQTRGYWVFQDYRFFVPTVFLCLQTTAGLHLKIETKSAYYTFFF